jgi:hypothetical protein
VLPSLLLLLLQTASGQLVRNTPNEELLWSYTVQLAAILRAAHATGLALRPAALSASKVRGTAAGVRGAPDVLLSCGHAPALLAQLLGIAEWCEV